MSIADENAPSVRVEFGDVEPGTDVAQIEPGKPSNGASGKRALVVAAVALFAVVGLIAALSPSSGSTAAGTPITTTTIPPDTTEVPSTTASVDDEEGVQDGVNSSASNGDPIDLYESAESPFLAFNVVAADVGWFVHGFDDDAQEGALYRSQDGLTWDRLDLSGVTNGLVVGFERVGDTFVVAIDGRSAWSDTTDGDLDTRGYEISFWESPDAANWVPAVGRPTMTGSGFPYPVKLSAAASVIPVITPPSASSLSGLANYLSGVMSAEMAQQVCGATTRLVPDTETEMIIFRDCDGEVLIEVEGEEATALINGDGPGVSICIDQLRAFGGQSSSLRYQGVDGGTETVDLSNQFALFGSLVGETFLGSLPSGSSTDGSFDCGQLPEASVDGGVLQWSPGEGVETVALPEVSPEVSFQGVAIAADGSAYLAGETSVLRASPPYTEWESLAIVDPADAPDGGLRGISIAADATMFMASDGAEWFFARPGDTEWTSVPARSRDFGSVLFAGDDFAIVEVQRAETTLIKVPLP